MGMRELNYFGNIVAFKYCCTTPESSVTPFGFQKYKELKQRLFDDLIGLTLTSTNLPMFLHS